MLEILLLVTLCKKMGNYLRDKGWSPLFMQILVVFGWFAFEFIGGLCYAIWIMATQGEEAVNDLGFALYVWALLSAAIGMGIVFLIARLLPDRMTDSEGENPFTVAPTSA